MIDTKPLRATPTFRRLFIGRACSGFGSQLTLVAVLFQVWQQTRSTLWTGAVGLAQAVPLIMVGLAAGALIDRSDRRRLYLLSTVGAAACSVALAIQAFVGDAPVLGVLALVALQSCFGAISGPTSRTFIPRLLPADQLAAGLALNRVSFQASVLVGPAVGGLLIAAIGVDGCYVVDALTFGLALHGAWGLPQIRPLGVSARPGLGGILDGLSFLVRTPAVRAALLTDLAATVLSFPISLFPLINAERFGDDPRTFGLFLTAIAVGGLTASLLSGTFTGSARPGLVMLAGSAVWGLSLTGFGLVPDARVGLALLVVAGAADTVAVVSRSSIVLQHTPDDMRGRVSAAEQVVGQAGPDVGNMRGGLVAAATSGPVALVSGGVLCVLAVALVGISTPALRAPVAARS